MMIDPYNETWPAQLEEKLKQMRDGANMYLLIDSAFVPGLFRSRELEGKIALLFEALPACSEAARDVSPFLVPVECVTRSLAWLLNKCSGWPMVSAVETTESLTELCSRLAAWCVIEVDNQRFNFRFPDTRRLPKIFATLTPQQRVELTGPASQWSYIGRDGHWNQLNVDGAAAEVAAQPVLDDAQFCALVGDSEPDEVLVQLAYQGFEPTGLPSLHHAIVCMALRIADVGKLVQELRVDWCEFVLKNQKTLNESDAESSLAEWRLARE